jgi:hypothetical protein
VQCEGEEVMRKVVPPFSRQPKERADFLSVPREWVISRFGEPHMHEHLPTRVLAPTDYWAFEIDNGDLVVLAHRQLKKPSLLVSSSREGHLWIAELLGLTDFEMHQIWHR